MSEVRKTQRARRRSAGWKVALVTSALVHATLLGVMYVYGRAPVERTTVELTFAPFGVAAAPLVPPVPEASRLEVAVVDQPPPIARPDDARPGDADDPVAVTHAPA
ncbi:MAG TPA: hypothetical protein VHG72_17480, partial [Polyangia bacterium]|nr:hypothetical protein [Polyangia bacterium]